MQDLIGVENDEVPKVPLAEKAQEVAERMGEGGFAESLRRIWKTAKELSPKFALGALPVSVLSEGMLPKPGLAEPNLVQEAWEKGSKFAFPKPAGIPTVLGGAAGAAAWWGHMALSGKEKGLGSLALYAAVGAAIGNHLE